MEARGGQSTTGQNKARAPGYIYSFLSDRVSRLLTTCFWQPMCESDFLSMQYCSVWPQTRQTNRNHRFNRFRSSSIVRGRPYSQRWRQREFQRGTSGMLSRPRGIITEDCGCRSSMCTPYNHLSRGYTNQIKTVHTRKAETAKNYFKFLISRYRLYNINEEIGRKIWAAGAYDKNGETKPNVC